MSKNAQYRLIPGSQISLQHWGDDVVVFHHGSGNTFLLNPSAKAALALFEDHQMTDEQFFEQIAHVLDFENDDDLKVFMAELRKSFCHLDLIEAV